MAIWSPTQKTKTKKLQIEGCQHKYEIEVPALRVKEAIENVFVRLQLQAKISGFRPGKAPLEMIKRQYEGHARSEAAEHVMKQVVPEVLQELDLRPISMPSVGDVSFEADTPLRFSLHIEVAPTFKPTGYKGITVTKKEPTASDADVEERLKHLLEGNARLEKAETDTASAEHYVVIEYLLTRDGKTIEGGEGKQELVDMSSDQTIAGLTENLRGMKREETREFEVQIEKKPAKCKATLSEIKVKILPKLDEEFAKDMGMESLDKLKSELKSIILKEAAEKSEREASFQIEQALLKANSFDLPPSLIEHQLTHMLERLVSRLVGPGKELPEKQRHPLREKMRPQAADQVRLQFILAEIAKKENISGTEEDYQQELTKSLESASDEKEKKEAREFYQKNKEDILAAIRERKVIAMIREAAKIKIEKA